jgi:alanine dehydrogenase
MSHSAGVTLWISEAEVARSLSLPEAIPVLAAGFAAEAAGSVAPLEKTMATFAGHGTLHALGAAFPDLAGTKTWAHTPGGADPVLLLFDSATGTLVTAIEAFVLGQLRTAGTAALATDLLARHDARSLAVIGTGKQALAQVAGVAAVRSLDAVRAFSPNQDHREAFARQVREQLDLPCTAIGSVAGAVAESDIVTLITRATMPVLMVRMVRPGMHVNAVGAIDLARREFDPAILGLATVVTDSVHQARNLSAELRDFFNPAESSWPGLRSLASVVREGSGRSDPAEITVFKGMGSGTEDLALGIEVLARVRKAGGGAQVIRHGRVAPTLKAEMRE